MQKGGYIPKEVINFEGSCFFWKHSFSHTFISIDCKQCQRIQLLKFENMILLGIRCSQDLLQGGAFYLYVK
jgi:hypothetical protein